MSVDNRTMLNDCEAGTGWTGDDAVTTVTLAGSFYEGSTALSWQASDADEQMSTTQDSVGAGTFSIDLSDSTLYMLIKDNLGDTAANGGVQYVIGDGTDLIGYDVGGNDATGIPLATFFSSYKLDVSNAPAAFTVFAGVEANLTTTAITAIGYGSLHLAKANGPSDNVFMDAFRYISNDSYALTINGGTSGTPETMADVAGDDVTNGWGLVGNPVGTLYYFFGPTEWGEVSAGTDHYFEANGEQWFWLGDNGGGHAVGATHFPFRVISNGTATNSSFVITQVAVVNTGTGAEFDCSSTDVNTLEIDRCSFNGLSSFNAPSSGGTSRFCTETTFTNCGQVTHNGANMSGCSILLSTVAADTGALLYNETTDPDGEIDDMTFSKGTNAHHAIDFGTNVTNDITLRGIEFTGFGTTEDGNDAALRFLATTGSLNCNIVGCTVDGATATSANLFKDDAAGVSVTLVFDPISYSINVKDNNGDNLQDARVYLAAEDGTGDLPYQESVTITRSGTTATVSHTAHGLNTNEYVNLAGITDKTEDNSGCFQITVTGVNSYTYTTTNLGSTNYTGSITSTGVLLYGLTDVNGDISGSRTIALDQNMTGYVRKSTTSPRFKSFGLSGTIIDSALGLSLNIRMILDE
jgi:hypothetical protein